LGRRRRWVRPGWRWLRAIGLALAVAPPAAAAHAPGDSLVISVLTMGPGREVFERFGHISIRVHDLRTGIDSAYNWGMFSFDQPRFLQRFLTGDTRYWMEGFPTMPLVAAYRSAGRWVTEQELALSPDEADSLRRFIQWNAREENKWYRYDYYRDNCSTRVRDALDMVLGGALRREVRSREHGVTYRSETLRLAAAYPVLDFGMDFALGLRADATLSAWQEMFIPMRLVELIRDVKVRRGAGVATPLVRAERRLVVDDRLADQPSPPVLFWPGLAGGIAFGVVLLVLANLAGRSGGARWGIAAIGTAWHAVAGSAGLLVLVLGVFTRHVFMARNVNLLLATPASLALAVLFPLAIARASERVVRAARSLCVLAAAAAVVALVLRVVPALAQENEPLLALGVPAQMALAFALWRATAARSGETA
jgi:hypothetical protein